jgi:hypothetical protein
LGEFSPVGQLFNLGGFFEVMYWLLASTETVLYLTGLGFILGDFFTKASGHTAAHPYFRAVVNTTFLHDHREPFHHFYAERPT